MRTTSTSQTHPPLAIVKVADSDELSADSTPAAPELVSAAKFCVIALALCLTFFIAITWQSP